VPDSYRGITYLSPGDIRFWRNDLGQLCATLPPKEDIEDVLVFRTRPISDPHRYISVRVGATPSQQRELGVIRNLNSFATDQRRLLVEELAKRYFIHIITRIRSIREELGFLYWDCDTDKGPRVFPVPRWDQRMVATTASGCRVVTDVDGNRYEIPRLEDLDNPSQAAFLRHIYW
jgi:hypothetical protein